MKRRSFFGSRTPGVSRLSLFPLGLANNVFRLHSYTYDGAQHRMHANIADDKVADNLLEADDVRKLK